MRGMDSIKGTESLCVAFSKRAVNSDLCHEAGGGRLVQRCLHVRGRTLVIDPGAFRLRGEQLNHYDPESLFQIIV